MLVADDDVTCRSLTEHTLSGLGVEIHVVKNGQEAVEAFAANSFDLVLMDCHMPTLDGFGAALLIREIETRERRTPIVALTGTAVGVELDRCREVGMDGHLDKLSGPQELRQALAEWLARVAPTDGSGRPAGTAYATATGMIGGGVPAAAPIVAASGLFTTPSAPVQTVKRAVAPPPPAAVPPAPMSFAAAPFAAAPLATAPFAAVQAAAVPPAAAAPHDAACVDVSVLEDLNAFSTPDDDLLAELCASFDTNVKEQLPRLEEAARAADAGAVRFIAHRLRGTCGNLGARRMQFLCERLEMLGREGVTAGALELTDDLAREYEYAREALHAWMRARP